MSRALFENMHRFVAAWSEGVMQQTLAPSHQLDNGHCVLRRLGEAWSPVAMQGKHPLFTAEAILLAYAPLPAARGYASAHLPPTATWKLLPTPSYHCARMPAVAVVCRGSEFARETLTTAIDSVNDGWKSTPREHRQLTLLSTPAPLTSPRVSLYEAPHFPSSLFR
jgi:hypothetical protein